MGWADVPARCRGQTRCGRGVARNAAIGVLMVVAMMFIPSSGWPASKTRRSLFLPVRLARGFPLPGTRDAGGRPLVGLLYCTYNDFSATSLLKSMQQDYPRSRTVILDDSTKPEIIAAADEFSRRYEVPISRRPDREGFKAGNL